MQQQYGLVSGEYMGDEATDIDALLDNAELMGYNMDDVYNNPEMLGGPFRNLFKRIAGRIRSRIAARRGGGGSSRGNDDYVSDSSPFSVSTPGGTMSLSDSGFTYIRSPSGKMIMVPKPAQSAMDSITKNPAILIGGVAVLILLLKKKKK